MGPKVPSKTARHVLLDAHAWLNQLSDSTGTSCSKQPARETSAARSRDSAVKSRSSRDTLGCVALSRGELCKPYWEGCFSFVVSPNVFLVGRVSRTQPSKSNTAFILACTCGRHRASCVVFLRLLVVNIGRAVFCCLLCPEKADWVD